MVCEGSAQVCLQHTRSAVERRDAEGLDRPALQPAVAKKIGELADMSVAPSEPVPILVELPRPEAEVGLADVVIEGEYGQSC